ncbi:MAG: hypothetical protein PHF20_08510 [Halothiobacillaceae bacterium]|nr:hypothetical protein [Halothiobacillaceae bacterium]
MSHTIQEIGLAFMEPDGTRQALFAVQDALRTLSAAAKDHAFLVMLADELAPPERSIKGKLLFLANHFTDMKERADQQLRAAQQEHDALIQGQQWLVRACANITLNRVPEARRQIEASMRRGQDSVNERRERLIRAGLSAEKAAIEVPNFDRAKYQAELDEVKELDGIVNLFLKTRNESLIEGIKHMPEFDDAYQKFHPAPTPPAPVAESSEAKLNRLMTTVFGG